MVPLRFINALCCPFLEFTSLAPLVAIFPFSTYFWSCYALIYLIIYIYVKFETPSMESMIRLNTEVFSVLEYPIFDLFK